MCRAMYPSYYLLHHCRERKTRYRKGPVNIPIGHLFIVFVDQTTHESLHAGEDRRDTERAIFKHQCEVFKATYDELFITEEEYSSIMEYK